jgi:hypothetical protein
VETQVCYATSERFVTEEGVVYLIRNGYQRPEVELITLVKSEQEWLAERLHELRKALRRRI